jgi:guanylate kinase
MVEQDALLEHAEYVAHSYGTPRAFVEQQMAAGMNVILDIEVQGARQVRQKMPEAVMIFIIPPDLEELRNRLIKRGTDSIETIEARLVRARQEYGEADFYDYIIVNDDLDLAAAEFAAIIRAEHCRYTERAHWLSEI